MASDPKKHADIVEAVIKARKTLKVIGDAQNRAVISPEVAEGNRTLVLDALRVSGWAPFHYARGEDDLAEPWRAHAFWHHDCQALAPRIPEWFPDMKPSNKIPKMMHACGAMVLVTWLPQFRHLDTPTPQQTAVDDEHLAAASAMVQNLLLMLTAHGMGTYWSSGGQLGSELFFDHVGIPANERLLAAVFVEFPETVDEPRERIPGKHRDSRSDGWIREWQPSPEN